MPKTVTITLREPIIGHEGPVRELVLRAPNLSEYARIGEPWTVVPGPDGNALVENEPAIAAYVDACVVEPKDKLLLGQVQLADAMDVKDAILEFFVDARSATRTGQPASAPAN